jgi:hypothetical protein
VAGLAQVSSQRRGLLAGFAFHSSSNPMGCLSSTIGWLDIEGAWTEAPEVIADRLNSAAGEKEQKIVDVEQLGRSLTLLAPVINTRLSLTSGRRWLSPDPTPAARKVASRLRQLIGLAARLRHHGPLLRLESMLGFVAGGHTAGEEMMIERLVDAPSREIPRQLSQVTGVQAGRNGIEVRLTGLIVFSPEAVD